MAHFVDDLLMPLEKLKSLGISSNISWYEKRHSYNGVSVVLDHFWTSNESLEFYSDSAGGTGSQKSFGIYFQLFPVVVAIQLWGTS